MNAYDKIKKYETNLQIAILGLINIPIMLVIIHISNNPSIILTASLFLVVNVFGVYYLYNESKEPINHDNDLKSIILSMKKHRVFFRLKDNYENLYIANLEDYTTEYFTLSEIKAINLITGEEFSIDCNKSFSYDQSKIAAISNSITYLLGEIALIVDPDIYINKSAICFGISHYLMQSREEAFCLTGNNKIVNKLDSISKYTWHIVSSSSKKAEIAINTLNRVYKDWEA